MVTYGLGNSTRCGKILLHPGLLEYLMVGFLFLLRHLYSVKRFLGNVRAYITLQNPSKAREFTEGLVGWKITCDAESCFTLSIHKRKRDNNWAIIPQIRIQVHKRDLPPRSSTRAGHKQSNFLIWKEPVDLIQSQAHFTSEGLARIKELKLVLNQKTPKNPLTTPLSKFSPESLQYLLGFVDGDGFFSVCRCSLSIIFKCKLDHQKHYYSTSSNSSSEGSAASSDTPTVSTYSKSDNFLEYFVGFVDGAGSFTIHRCGNYYKLQFSISQALYNIRILYYIKSKLGYGSVSTNKNKGVADFRISDRKSLAKVIFPIFDTYLLRTSKYFNYVRFKYAYDILEDPNLSSEDKAKQLESLLEEPLPVDYVSPPLGPQRGHRTSAEALDDLGPPGPALGPLRALGPQTGGTGGALKNLDPLQSPYEEISLVITDNWLSGYVEAEGCFGINRDGLSFNIEFFLVQKLDGRLLELIRRILHIPGKIIKNRQLNVLKTKNKRALYNIKDAFEGKFKGMKGLEFKLWCKALYYRETNQPKVERIYKAWRKVKAKVNSPTSPRPEHQGPSVLGPEGRKVLISSEALVEDRPLD
jgi:hypothetical protein